MPTVIIAEAAQGFEGDPRQALLLARAAARAGADFVKFQLVYADELATPAYQYYELYKTLEMEDDAWLKVADAVEEDEAKLCFDVFGPFSLRKAKEFGAAAVKIHSTDFFNEDLIQGALAEFETVFMSFGGIQIEELAERIAALGSRTEKVIFLYGFQAEPTSIEMNNLARLPALRAKFPGVRFGFMDHSDGDAEDAQTLSLLAMGLGAVAIEKHITLDRLLQIEDYVSALPGDEFAGFVERIRHLENALGSDALTLTEEEAAYRGRALKVALAASDLPAGTTLSAENVVFKRAGSPVATPIHRAAAVHGRSLKAAVKANDPILPENLA